MSPDDVCVKYSDQKVKFDISIEGDYVYLTGNKKTLLFLSELIKAQAEFELDDNFFISKNRRKFNKDSKFGLMIIRTNNK